MVMEIILKNHNAASCKFQVPNDQIPNKTQKLFAKKTEDLTDNIIEIETKKDIFDYKLLVCYNHLIICLIKWKSH
jgi:hypothetical protein